MEGSKGGSFMAKIFVWASSVGVICILTTLKLSRGLNWQTIPCKWRVSLKVFSNLIKIAWLTSLRAIDHARQSRCTQTFHNWLVKTAAFMDTQQILLAKTWIASPVIAFILFKRILSPSYGNTIVTTFWNLEKMFWLFCIILLCKML